MLKNELGGRDRSGFFEILSRDFEVFSGDAVNLCRFLRISEDFYAFFGGFWSFLRILWDFTRDYLGFLEDSGHF